MINREDVQQFIEGFRAYLAGSESNFLKCFEMMRRIEFSLRFHPELMAILFLWKDAEALFAQHGKSTVIQHVQLVLSTKLAEDKLLYSDLGLLKTKQKGDLRGAELTQDPHDQFFAMLRFGSMRQNPAAVDFVTKEGAKLDAKFHERLARALRRPPIEMEHLNLSKLRRFIVRYWLIQRDDAVGKLVPPLCFCSDSVIAKLAGLCGIQAGATEKLVRKTWERLGLRKAPQIVFFDADVKKISKADHSVRRLILSDVRRPN